MSKEQTYGDVGQDLANIVYLFKSNALSEIPTSDHISITRFIAPKDKRQTETILAFAKTWNAEFKILTDTHIILTFTAKSVTLTLYVSSKHLERIEEQVERTKFRYPALEALLNQQDTSGTQVQTGLGKLDNPPAKS